MESKRSFTFLTLPLVLAFFSPSCAPGTGAAAPTPTAILSTIQTPVAKSTALGAATSTPKPAAKEPRYGGVLNISTYADLGSLDVQQESGSMGQAAIQSAYSGLLQFNPVEPDKIIGDLAETWEVDPAGTVFTFHLHKGVKFHDGSPLTADDVKFSLERLYNPPKDVISPRKETLAAIKEVATPDQDTVRVTLKFAQSSFLPMLSVGQVAVYPKKVVQAKGDMKKDVVGTGPFAFKEYSPGILYEVRRNPTYFVKGRPYLGGLRFYVLKDESTKLSAFRTGQIKLIDPTKAAGLMPSQLQIIHKEMPQATIVKYPSLSSQWLNMIVILPPFDDVRVRRAVKLAVDRQAAIKVLMEGEADIGGVFVSGSDWATPEAELLKLPGFRQPKDADIAEAKKLLAEAGFEKGFKTKILARAKRTENVAVLMKEQLAKIGIELELVIQESSQFLEQIYKLAFPMVANPIGVRMTDPDEFTRYFASGASPRTGLKDDKLDRLFEEQSKALDPGTRKKIVRDIEAKLMDASATVVLFWERGKVAHWPEVKNYYRGGVYNNNKLQDVWLAK